MVDEDAGRIEKLFSSPVHLNDDVMIALRPGYILNETGTPSLNRTDLSQPATSYAVPYLYASILKVSDEPISIFLYTGLAFLLMAAMVFITVYYAKSRLLAISMMLITAYSLTNTLYVLHAKDHIFMAFFLLLSTFLVLRWKDTVAYVILLSLFSLAAFLFRPDGFILAAFLLLAALLRTEHKLRYLVYSGSIFGTLFLVVLYLNYSLFGYITPTTARLKIGASPTMEYILHYAHGLVFEHVTIMHLILVCFGLIILFFNRFKKQYLIAIIAGSLLTILYALYNSDVFVGGRMFFGAAVVLIFTVTQIVDPRPLIMEIQESALFRDLSARYRNKLRILKWISLMSLLLLIYSLGRDAVVNIYESLVTEVSITSSEITKQFLLTEWINTHLEPDNGSIGLFYLGIGYHLRDFELADFLGKGDEMIAQTEVKWGPPGHNKWDIDKSLDKWSPQVIIPAAPVDIQNDFLKAEALIYIEERLPFSFQSELILNDRMLDQYHYCFAVFDTETFPDYWGMFVRNDIAAVKKEYLNCYSL